MVCNQMMANVTTVGVLHSLHLQGVGKYCLCGEPPCLKGLTNSFTGEGVTGHDRIANEQNATRSGRGCVDPRWNWPGRVSALEDGRIAEPGTNVRSVDEITPDIRHVLNAS
jgi:hypothetical protein